MFFRRKKEPTQETNTEQKVPFKSEGMEELIAYVKEFCGVDLQPKKEVLSRRLATFCENKRVGSFLDLISKIKFDKELSQDFVNLITVNETYFYRELPQLEEVIKFANTLSYNVKILCAPCASGEEVYSLAFLADQARINLSNISILGIDINSEAIDQAKEALYTQRALHRLDDEIKTKYFVQEDNKYRILKDKVPCVDFRVVNIFDNKFLQLGSYDIILSRNMMIYFNDDFKRKAIKHFYDLLQPHGRLFTGHADLVPQNEYFTKEVQRRMYYFIKN